MRRLLLALLLAFPTLAWADDCGPAPTIPLYLGLHGLPGVPRGFRGGTILDVPAQSPDEACPLPDPPLPADILHGSGADGDTLKGRGHGDLLRGTEPTPSVTVEGVR